MLVSRKSTVLSAPAGRLCRRSLSVSLGLLLAAAAALPAMSLDAPAAAASVRRYDVPAGPLGETLGRFVAAAGVSLSFDGNDVSTKASAGLKGSYTVEQGFTHLLAGTGFAAVRGTDGVYALHAAASATRAGASATPHTEASGKTATNLPGLNVTGVVGGIVATDGQVGTKSDTPLIETPQAISVVTRAQMDVQNVQSVSQALRYTSGSDPEQRGANTDALEYIYSRGFQIDEYLNGLRWYGANFNITSMDAYLIDHIELAHGPSSVLYGQGSPGGLLSLSSKLPTDAPFHEVMFQAGNYGRAQAAMDLSGPLDADGHWLGRLTLDSLDTGTQTDHVRQKRLAVAPSLTWKPDEATSLTLMANYQRDPDAGLFNYVPANGTVLPGLYRIPRDLDMGDPDYDRYSKTQSWIGYSFVHHFNDAWSVVQNARYLHNSTTIQSVGFGDNGLYAPNGGLSRWTYYNSGTVNSQDVDTQLHGAFDTGAIQHQLTAGVDVQRNHDSHVFTANIDGSTPPLDPNDPVYGLPMPAPDFMFGTSSVDRARQEGIYLQDQLRWGSWLATLGMREDWSSENSRSLKTDAITDQKNSAFTYRGGLTYLFDNGIAPYVSYSTSFQPTLGLDANGNAYKPTTGEQAEVGVKYQPSGHDSFVTLAAYDLRQQNVQTPDPDNAQLTIQTGEVRSRGIELEGHAQLNDTLQLIASYTYNALKNTRSNSSNLDKVPAGSPRNMSALWLDYSVPQGALHGLRAGVGVRYVGGSYGDAINSFSVPSYTLVDVAAHYNLGEAWPRLQGWSTALTASNLTGKTYVTCTGLTYCTFGAGRLLLANVKYQW